MSEPSEIRRRTAGLKGMAISAGGLLLGFGMCKAGNSNDGIGSTSAIIGLLVLGISALGLGSCALVAIVQGISVLLERRKP